MADKSGEGKIIISKNYSRKVNLSGISSQYDNIEIATFISKEIDATEDIQLAIDSLHKIVYAATEKDIISAMEDLLEKSKNPDNSVFLGIPKAYPPVKSVKKVVKTVTKKEDIDIDDIFKDDLELEPEEIVVPKPKEEIVELEDFDLESYQGDLLS